MIKDKVVRHNEEQLRSFENLRFIEKNYTCIKNKIVRKILILYIYKNFVVHSSYGTKKDYLRVSIF